MATTLSLFSVTATAGEVESSIARGGELYDKWFKVVNADTPKSPNPAYPSDKKYYGKKGADWRCKECHGWDYMGAKGAYSKGKHHTGFKGVSGAAGSNPATYSTGKRPLCCFLSIPHSAMWLKALS